MLQQQMREQFIGNTRQSLKILAAIHRNDTRAMLKAAERRVLTKRKSKHLIFVAAMPKSGSTFLSKRLARCLGYKWGHLSDIPGGCEFDIYRPALIAAAQQSHVIQQHTLATEGNIEYLRRYNATVIVTLRDFVGALSSFRRHLVAESLRWPFVNVPASFREWPEARQIDLLIDLVLPWMLNFVSGWQAVHSQGTFGDSLRFFDYRDLKKNEPEAIRRLYEHATHGQNCSHHASSPDDESNTSHRKSNRPDQRDVQFSQRQLTRIAEMARHFPDSDFSTLLP